MFRLIYTVSLIFLLSACSNMLFYPLKPHLIDPAARGVEYEDIYLQTANGQQLHGWVLPQTGELKGTILFFHGNGQNISTHIGAVYWLPKYGYRVVLVDYRGYGKSDGKATLDGSIVDIQKSIEFAYEKYSDAKPFIVLGQSIGGSMSIFAVAKSEFKTKIDALLLIAPFSDYHDIAQETLSKSWLTWLFQYPLSWTISNEYRPLDFIAEVNPVPVYFVHGSSDQIINPKHSEELFKRAIAPKEFYLIDGGHNDLAARDEYKRVLLEILQNIERNVLKGQKLVNVAS